LGERKPTLAFFHSNNCYSCLVMVDMVELIHPEFAEQVPWWILMCTTRAIRIAAQMPVLPPFLPWYLSVLKGEAEVIMGIMEEDQLRQQLQNIMGAN
jgi:hypothetical protein